MTMERPKRIEAREARRRTTRPAAAARTIALTFVAVLLPTIATAEDVSFEEHVGPLFERHCTSCHDQDDPAGGLNLTTYRGTMRGGGGGSVIVPGNAARSRLMRLVTHAEKPVMPPEGAKLPDAELDVLRKWIAAGAPEKPGAGAVAASSGFATKPKTAVAAAAPPALGLVDPGPRRKVPLLAVASHPQKPIAAVAVDGEVMLIDFDRMRFLASLSFPHGEVFVLKFNRAGDLLLTAGGVNGLSGRAVVWNIETGRRLIEVGDERDVVLAADLSPDQTMIALGGPKKKVRVHATSDGRLIRTIDKHSEWITALAFSPDGILLASADRSGKAFLWESLSGYEFAELPAIEKPLTSLAWRPDAEALAVGDDDGQLRVFGIEPAEELAAWAAHPGGVRNVAFAPDGESLLSCGRDRLVKQWSNEGKELRAVAKAADEAQIATFDHSGKLALFGDFLGNLRLVDCESAQSLATIEPRRPLLSEAAAGSGPSLQSKLHAIRAPTSYNYAILGVGAASGCAAAWLLTLLRSRRRWRRYALSLASMLEAGPRQTSKPRTTSGPNEPPAPDVPRTTRGLIPRPHFLRIRLRTRA